LNPGQVKSKKEKLVPVLLSCMSYIII